MAQIPVFRLHTERMEKARFEAIAGHLGIRGDVRSTEEALFVQDKQRALAYAMPGARFAGLLFYADQGQPGMGAVIERAVAAGDAEAWTGEFLKRFQLVPRQAEGERFRTSFATRVVRGDALRENADRKEPERVPVKMDVVSDLSVDGRHVTGPRARVRLVFKSGRAPVFIHRALWERLEVFEEPRLVSEDEAHRRIVDRLSRRGEAERTWRVEALRLAYFAGPYGGGPDLLLPYYFVDVEMRSAKERERARQGPRQLIQVPAFA